MSEKTSEKKRAEECGNCRFFKAIDFDDYDYDGECRRYAPRAILSDGVPGDFQPVFPEMFNESWCGEWESANA